MKIEGGISLGIWVLCLVAVTSTGWSETSISEGKFSELEQELETLLVSGAEESGDLDQLIRLASIYLDLGYGMYVEPKRKLAAFQEGSRVAYKAVERAETSPEAHFLYAANLGSAAELQGLVTAAFTIREIKYHVNRVLELDNTYVPAHHMLGRLYEELPWFLGGDQEKAEKHLKKAVALDFRYAPARLDLARWYLKNQRNREARKELTFIIETPPIKKRWIWERIHRPQALQLLKGLPVFPDLTNKKSPVR